MRLFRRPPANEEREPGRRIVVGLGNPGPEYADTRHNVGAMVVATLLERTGARLKSHKSGCATAEVTLAGERVVLARPTSFMNESGRPVRALASWYKSGVERIVVVHDELDIPFGTVKVKQGGGTAGHNGLGSIVSHLGSPDFARVRVGIGRPRSDSGATDHVLQRFSAGERKELPGLLEAAADAVERIIEVGAERTMNEVNAHD